MAEVQSVNDYVFLIRDEIKKEMNGLLMPAGSQVKPHRGKVVSVGDLVKSQRIRSAKGRYVLYHPTIGFGIEYEGVEYWVLAGHEIIAVL